MSSFSPTDAPPRDEHVDLLAPSWMTWVLRAAGIYNIVWGAWAILFPLAIFRWAGFDPLPEYPELWQCIGMIVGVYGVGYWVAGNAPYRHWPIVLVGLLGKVFGPIGFVGAVWNERFPAVMGATILTNDLIWWVPFTLILFGAARASQTATMLAQRENQPHDSQGRPFEDVVADGRSFVILLRHAGCTFCRQALVRVSAERASIEADDTRIVLVHMGDESDETAAFFAHYGLDDVARVSDPGGVLYERFALPNGSFKQLFGLRVWWRGFRAFVFERHGVGTLVGNGFQMPGCVWVDHGRVVRVDRAEDAASIPTLCAVNSDSASDCEQSLRAEASL